MGFLDCRLRQERRSGRQAGGKQGPGSSAARGEGGLARRHISSAAGNEGLTGHLQKGGLGGIGEQRPDQRGSTEGAALGRTCMLPLRWLAPLQAHPTPYGLGNFSPSHGDNLLSAPHSTLLPSLSVRCVHSSNHRPPWRKSIKAASVSS